MKVREDTEYKRVVDRTWSAGWGGSREKELAEICKGYREVGGGYDLLRPENT